MDYPILHDYRAIRCAGSVRKTAKTRIVLHSMESTNQSGAAEGTGSWFENRSCQGSTQYGVDENSIQQYLPDLAIPWGAAQLNTNGIHIEQMGTESWSRDEWLKKAPGTLQRTAWLMAMLSERYDIPLRWIKGDTLRTNARGVTTHEWSTDEYHIYGGHTDPGHNYPYDYVLQLAKHLAGDEPVNIVALKKAMLAYAKVHEVKIPHEFALTKAWGPGAQTLAWRVSGRLKAAGTKVDGKLLVQTGKPRKALVKALA